MHTPASVVRDIKTRSVIIMYYPSGATLDQGPTAVVPGSQFFSVDTRHLEPDSGVRLAGPGEMPAEHGARDRWLRESIEPLGGDGFGTADEDLRVVVPPGAVLITHCEHHSLPDGSLLHSFE